MMKGKKSSCYGKFRNHENCRWCRYRRSCRYYTATAGALERGLNLVDLRGVQEYSGLAADCNGIPGCEPEEDQLRYSVADLSDLLRYLINLDRYTLVILREIITRPGEACTITDLVKRIGTSRQSIYRKIIRAVKAHPELERILLLTLTRMPSGIKNA